MRITINITKGMEMNMSPLVFPMNFDFNTPERLLIKVKKLPESRLIENRMTGTLFTEDRGPGTSFTISNLDDDGEYLNMTCLINHGRM